MKQLITLLLLTVHFACGLTPPVIVDEDFDAEDLRFDAQSGTSGTRTIIFTIPGGPDELADHYEIQRFISGDQWRVLDDDALPDTSYSFAESAATSQQIWYRVKAVGNDTIPGEYIYSDLLETGTITAATSLAVGFVGTCSCNGVPCRLISWTNPAPTRAPQGYFEFASVGSNVWVRAGEDSGFVFSNSITQLCKHANDFPNGTSTKLRLTLSRGERITTPLLDTAIATVSNEAVLP